MPSIVYLENCKNLLNNLGLGDKTDELLKAQKYFDYAGGICLPKSVVQEESLSISNLLNTFLKDLSNENNDTVYFRAGKYYLNFVFDDDIDQVRKSLAKGIFVFQDIIDRFNQKEYSLESKLMITSILDHKKHYSMSILGSFFNHMLIKEDLDENVYTYVKENCVKDILNYYRFLLMDELGEQGIFSKDVINIFKHDLVLPESRPPSFEQPKGESTARKIIIREMDHPMQIVLFSGQILDKDSSGSIDFVINPLNGALEIGYAIKSIYDLLKLNKVNDIFLIKYSRYGEMNTKQRSLSSFVPLKENLQNLKERRLLIIDDNVFTGATLLDIREMCETYTSKVGVAAIEKMMSKDDESLLKYQELDIKPISKLRYIERVISNILDNNLKNL